jgi:hypothetical protein
MAAIEEGSEDESDHMKPSPPVEPTPKIDSKQEPKPAEEKVEPKDDKNDEGSDASDEFSDFSGSACLCPPQSIFCYLIVIHSRSGE